MRPNSIPRMLKYSMKVCDILCKFNPQIRRKSNAMDLFRRLEARCAAEVDIYNEVDRQGLMQDLYPLYCFEQCRNWNESARKALQDTLLLPALIKPKREIGERVEVEVEQKVKKKKKKAASSDSSVVEIKSEEDTSTGEDGDKLRGEGEEDEEGEEEEEEEEKEEDEDEDRISNLFFCSVSTQTAKIDKNGNFILTKGAMKYYIYPSVKDTVFRNTEGEAKMEISPVLPSVTLTDASVSYREGSFERRLQVCTEEAGDGDSDYSFKSLKNRLSDFISSILNPKDPGVPTRNRGIQMLCKEVVCDEEDDCYTGYNSKLRELT
ncbi:uncharacterized protein LOC112051877 [Bicyclus anynana]|uniref:Uncharacterized protein LOC112051877 n=1 Tax=Bicyclus anynana TaxID=110368 RepID=A0ABM3M6P5_BICAN|nr:uncharacterized protein LOC112051877 [Bicyclus anynana]